MTHDEDRRIAEVSCPDCGSLRAVGKDVAWDALCDVPPKVKAELARLQELERVALRVVASEVPDPEAPMRLVPMPLFYALCAALKAGQP